MSKTHTQHDSSPSSFSEDWQALAIQLLKSCGYGRLLIIGLQDPELLCELLRRGVDVTGLTASPAVFSKVNAMAPGRVRLANPSAPLDFDPNESFATVVCFAGDSVPDIWYADDALPRRLVCSGRSVMLVLLGSVDFHTERAAWDERFLLAGARRSPLSHEVAPYGSFDEPAGRALLLYERVVQEAVAEVVSSARNSADVFDALGFSIESEAYAARYELAAKFARPDDRVLDVITLVGAGAYLLARTTAASVVAWHTSPLDTSLTTASFASIEGKNLTFEPTPQHGLQSLASESFDFVIVHNSHDERDLLWSEARRVLTPGGRLYVCQQIGGVGGEAQGGVMQAQLESAGLLLERSWLQHTQSAQSGGADGRFVEELHPEDMAPAIGDWIVLLAMKSVTDYSPGVGQTVTDNVHVPNVIAFSRDYENPWLVRGLVAMGLRATSVSLRVIMADDVLAAASENSADHGAALCVRCYAELEAGSGAEVLRGWLQRALIYADLTVSNPSMTRWQISLLFVAGLMAMRIGDLGLAESTFSRVGSMDALRFSPLLGTKTVGAALRCGIIAFARGDNVCARREWSRALSETHRLLRDGDWREIIVDGDRPELFGLPEVAAFVMEGARAAGGLRALHDYPDKPSLVWQALHCTQEDALQALDHELHSLRRWWKDHDHQRDLWIEQLEQAKAWLSRQSAAWEEQVRLRDDQLRDITNRQAQFDEGKAWLEQQVASWEAAAATKDEQLQSARAENLQLNEAKAWLEQQLASWEAEAVAKDDQLRSARAENLQLNEAKAWLEQQLASWEAEAGAKGEQLQSARAENLQLNEAKTRLEQQVISWQEQASLQSLRREDLAGQLNKMRDNVERIRQSNSLLLAQRQQLERRVEALQGEVGVLAKTLIDESLRREAIESSPLVRLGNKLGLIQTKDSTL